VQDTPRRAPVSATPKPAPVKAARKTIRPFEIASVTARRETLPKPVLTEPAPAIAAVTRLERALAINAVPLPRAAVTAEPVRISVLRRAIGTVPGLGFLKKRKRDDEDYIPPRALELIAPQVPSLVSEDVPVRVKVKVAESGEVASAELVTRNVGPSFARAAIEAARRSSFAPAKLEEKAVASEMILNFRFPATVSGM
jgi:TonB family protein